MVALAYRGASLARLRTHPLNLIRVMPAKGVFLKVRNQHEPWAEPGFARRKPWLSRTEACVKEGAHGGTMGSPVL